MSPIGAQNMTPIKPTFFFFFSFLNTAERENRVQKKVRNKQRERKIRQTTNLTSANSSFGSPLLLQKMIEILLMEL